MSIEKKGTDFDLGDLARAIYDRYGYDEAVVRMHVQLIAEILPEILAEHRRIELPFGVIRLKSRKARVGRNFATRESIVIPPSLKVSLKASDELIDQIESLTEMPVR
jgi:Bacterial nucleoid DNA-binding protein